jgi:hypothetical protein
MVFYHTGDTESIISFAQERNLFAVSSRSDYVQTAVSSKKDASYPIEAITLAQPRAFDLQSPGILRLISLSLLGIGTLQILRGNFALPAWHAAFWYAYNLRAASQIQKPSA